LSAFKEVPMTVKAILSRKGGDVVTIAPTASLTEAVQLLAERRIGALVVTGPENRVAGILSERDIVRTLAARGPAALDDNVGAVMTRKVTTCTEADTIASLMSRLVGVISIGDVVKYRIEEVVHDADALREYIATA
jgi:CBS domain-containing protein